jgi:hypothetical protein
MGLDANLFLNSKVSLEDIQTVIKSKLSTETKVRNTHTPQYVIFEFTGNQFEGRHINIHLNNEMGGFSGTLLSMRSGEVADKILEVLAQTFGGFYCRMDCDNYFKEFRGSFYTGDVLPYFLKYHLLHGGENNDIDGLIETIKQWEKEIGSSHIKGLSGKVEK